MGFKHFLSSVDDESVRDSRFDILDSLFVILFRNQNKDARGVKYLSLCYSYSLLN